MNTIEFQDACVQIDELVQYSTYLGLLLGIPGKNENDSYITAAEEKAGRLFTDWPIKVIQPPRIKLEDEKYSKLRKDPERLPWVTCIADLSNSKPIKDGDSSRSVLVWWQDEPAFPIDPDIAKIIKNTKWDSFAKDAFF
jgi:hypothetical protein